MLLPSTREFIKKLRGRPRSEMHFAAHAWLLAPLVEGSLAAFGVQRTLRGLEAMYPLADRRDLAAPTIARAAQLVDAAYLRHLVRGTCLPRSLIQYALLRRGGHAVRFVFGVNNDDGLRAHAWVEAADQSDDAYAEGDVAFVRLVELGA